MFFPDHFSRDLKSEAYHLYFILQDIGYSDEKALTFIKPLNERGGIIGFMTRICDALFPNGQRLTRNSYQFIQVL